MAWKTTRGPQEGYVVVTQHLVGKDAQAMPLPADGFKRVAVNRPFREPKGIVHQIVVDILSPPALP